MSETRIIDTAQLAAFQRRSSFESAKGRWLLTDWAVFYKPPQGKHKAMRWDEIEKIDFGGDYVTAHSRNGNTLSLPVADAPFLHRIFDLLKKHGIQNDKIAMQMVLRKLMTVTLKEAKSTSVLWKARIVTIPAYLAVAGFIFGFGWFFNDPRIGFGASFLRGLSSCFGALTVVLIIYTWCSNLYGKILQREYETLSLALAMLHPSNLKLMRTDIKEQKEREHAEQAARHERLLRELQHTPRTVHKSLRSSLWETIRNFCLILYLGLGLLLIPVALCGRDACRDLLGFCWTYAGQGTVTEIIPVSGKANLKIEYLDPSGNRREFLDNRLFSPSRYQLAQEVPVSRYRGKDVYRVRGFRIDSRPVALFVTFLVPVLFFLPFLYAEAKRSVRLEPMLEHGNVTLAKALLQGINSALVEILNPDGSGTGRKIKVYAAQINPGDRLLVAYAPTLELRDVTNPDPMQGDCIGHAFDPPHLNVQYNEEKRHFEETPQPVLTRIVISLLVLETCLWGGVLWWLL